MIFDQLQHSDLYTRLNPWFEKGFTFLENKETTTLAPGKYDLDGDHLFAIVQEYDTKAVEEGKWEAHQKYIDIQYMVSGAEIMGIAPISQMQVSQVYDAENDYTLFTGKGEEIVVREGFFTIFYPHDVHMPGLWIREAKKIRKIVLKVRLEF